MNINIDIIKSNAEELIKIAEKAESKVKQNSFTREDLLKFLDDFKEKNSFIMEELGLGEFIR